MSTMVTFGNDSLATRFLSKEEMKTIAPKAFLTSPSNPNVSNRYAFASTEQVIDDLAELGWNVVDIKQRKERKENSVRSFHIVIFQNPNISIKRTDYVDADGRNFAYSRVEQNEDGSYIGYDRYGHSFPVTKVENVESYPRIILTNSHDGFNAFTFRVGLFRLVCSNGLVVCTDSFVDVSVRHTKYNVEILREIVAKAIASVDEQIGTFNDMQNVELTPEQKNEFAVNAIKIRKGLELNDQCDVDEEGITDLLTPVRKEDEGNSLWAVFNVLQEKVTKGGAIVGIGGKKARKMRGIKSFSKDIAINQQLYKTALSYLNLAA